MNALALTVLLLAATAPCCVLCDDWTEISNHNGLLQGISFSSTTQGLAVGGFSISRTTDGGVTWSDVKAGTFSMTLLTVMAHGSEAVAAGIGETGAVPGSAYSTNGGVSFNATTDSHLECTWFKVAAIPDTTSGVAMAGQWIDVLRSGSGIMVSSNGGHTWTEHNCDIDGMYQARGVSFVSSRVGWIVGGTPSNDSSQVRGVIAQTTDGGWSWATQFDTTGILFDDISCIDTKNCFAIADGTDGGHIFGTTDGSTWKEQIMVPGCTMNSIVMLSAKEGWAAGGFQQGIAYHGDLFHTLDGGASWMPYEYRGYIFTGLSAVDSQHVWASALSETGGGAVLQYVPN